MQAGRPTPTVAITKRLELGGHPGLSPTAASAEGGQLGGDDGGGEYTGRGEAEAEKGSGGMKKTKWGHNRHFHVTKSIWFLRFKHSSVIDIRVIIS